MLSGPGHSANLERFEQINKVLPPTHGGSITGLGAGPASPSGSVHPSGFAGEAGLFDAGAGRGGSEDPATHSQWADAALSQLADGAAPAGVGDADPSCEPAEALIGIDEVQKALNRSRASVYRYTNTDPRILNPPFHPRRLNPEYRTDQKDPLLFHPNEVARFARDVLRIKEVTVEVLNSPSTATQQLLGSILDELRAIRQRLDRLDGQPGLRQEPPSRFDQHSRPAA